MEEEGANIIITTCSDDFQAWFGWKPVNSVIYDSLPPKLRKLKSWLTNYPCVAPGTLIHCNPFTEDYSWFYGCSIVVFGLFEVGEKWKGTVGG